CAHPSVGVHYELSDHRSAHPGRAEHLRISWLCAEGDGTHGLLHLELEVRTLPRNGERRRRRTCLLIRGIRISARQLTREQYACTHERRPERDPGERWYQLRCTHDRNPPCE